jgi:hypothetical protein
MQTLTTKRIVWLRPDGGLSITHPVEDPLEGEIEQHYLDRLAVAFQSASPDHAGYVRQPDVEGASLPSRRWRMAWAVSAGAVAVPITKARTVRKGELMAYRDALVAAAAAVATKADDTGDAATVAKVKKARKDAYVLDTTIDAQLAAVADLPTLDTYTPPELAGLIAIVPATAVASG